MSKTSNETKRNLYGRHSGRPLRSKQYEALKRIEKTHSFSTKKIASLSKRYEQTWLEIGFGAGEHLAWQAQHNPSALIIGAEYYLNGFARACKYVEDERLNNVRLHHGDARSVLDSLAASSLSRVFILHPDPWPKKRQWRRRIVNNETLDRLAQLITPGGILRVASDHADYQPWIMRLLLSHPEFKWTATKSSDWTTRKEDWPQTRYEAKSLREGRPSMYIEVTKL